MATIKNPVRHYDRLHNAEHISDIKFTPIVENHTHLVCEEYLEETTKTMQKRMVEKPIKFDDSFKASDFKLENLISIGAASSLQSCKLSMSTLHCADTAADTLSAIQSSETQASQIIDNNNN